ncbi:MAG: DUF1573 domain-containing protein [Deltaproteobacteria bacterium]|nr:DUF1573 domain-containing protein [Deltaproteobacteria bacterium]
MARRALKRQATGRGAARVLAAAAMAAAVGCASGGAPQLAVAPLPAERVGDLARAAFELRNDGGRVLVLDRVVPGCGCVARSRLPPELAPGAATRLDVECRGPRIAGDETRELRVRTSDPRSPETLVRVAVGRVPAGLPAVYLGYVAVGTTLVRDVSLAMTSGDVLPRADGEVAVEPQPAAGDGTRLVRLRFTPHAAGVVRTTVDLGPAGRLPLVAIAYERALAFPAEIRVPRATGAPGLPTVTLVAAGTAPLAIARVEYPPGVAGELRAVVPERQYRLVLQVRGAIPTGNGAIRVVAEGTTDPVLVIPLVDATVDGGTRPPA